MEFKKKILTALVLLIFTGVLYWIIIPRNVTQNTIENIGYDSNKLAIHTSESSSNNNNLLFPASSKRAGQTSDSPPNTLNKVVDPLDIIRQDCGELCDTSRKGSPGIFFDQVNASVNCEAIFRNDYIDRGHGLPHAPKTIPKELLKEYTMNNRLPVHTYYFDQRYLGKKALSPVWKKKQIEEWIRIAKNGNLHGTYGASETNALRDGLKHAPGIKNGRVLVIGSENPWVEACVLEAGAREVMTLEYGSINSEHPQVETIIPSDFRKRFLNNSLGTFDGIVTFSSVEHSGLGRYGDALNPWGDILAIARAWCVTRPGGSLTIGVMYNFNRDEIAFNAHRVYGKIRYPYLTTNWKQLYLGHGSQRVHVFTK